MAKKITKKEIESLLNRYHAGQCTTREIEIIEQWYRSYDGVDVPGLADAAKREEIKSAMRDNIRKRIHGPGKSRKMWQDGSIARRPNRRHYAAWWSAAAALVISVAATYYFYSADLLRANEGGPISHMHDADVTTGKTNQSDTPVLYLPDGSVVWLTAESRLTFPKSFDGTNREVTLIGEAFFDVAKDASKPFIIHSPSFTTRVLGTTFNIKDHAHQDLPEVAVVSGEVMVSLDPSDGKNIRQLILRPNKKVTYSREEDALVETQVDHIDANAASRRKLSFEGARLADIITVLNAEYGVNIHLSDEALNDCLITGDFTGLDTRVGLEALSKSINGQYSIDGENIMISGPGCENQP